MSPKWARLHYRVLPCYSSNNTLSGTECTCKSATSKYGMHLQKCNLKIWNYSPLWAPSLEENQPIIPEWTEKVFRRSVLAEGECEFWDHLCPGFAPNPLLLLLGISFLVWFWSVCSSSSMEALRFALLQHCTYNACITSEAGGGQDSHPRHRITITIAFRIPRILGEERATRNAPFT